MGIDISKPFPKRPRLRDFDYLGTYSYFITILTKNRGSHFKEVEVVRTLTDILLEEARSEKFNILTYCFMPDHLYLLVIGQDDRSDARKFVRLFKQKSGYWFKKNYNKNLWHISYYDHVLRKEESMESVALYILENPVRKGLVSDYREYPFSRSSIYG